MQIHKIDQDSHFSTTGLLNIFYFICYFMTPNFIADSSYGKWTPAKCLYILAVVDKSLYVTRHSLESFVF